MAGTVEFYLLTLRLKILFWLINGKLCFGFSNFVLHYAIFRAFAGGSLEWETQNEYKILVMNPEVKNVSVTPGRTSADVI